MSDSLDAHVIRVPAIAMWQIERWGETAIRLLQSTALARPEPINVAEIVEVKLPQFDVDVYPVNDLEIPGSEAVTLSHKHPVQILMVQRYFDALFSPQVESNRARATLLHELAHVVLHVGHVRRSLAMALTAGLTRVERSSIKTYEDPEWQAWALAGCIAMPRVTLKMLPNLNIPVVAQTYQVSEQFVNQHLRRLKMGQYAPR